MIRVQDWQLALWLWVLWVKIRVLDRLLAP